MEWLERANSSDGMNRAHLIIATFASVMLALSGCVDDDANSVGSDADASVRGASMSADGTMGAGGADGAGGNAGDGGSAGAGAEGGSGGARCGAEARSSKRAS